MGRKGEGGKGKREKRRQLSTPGEGKKRGGGNEVAPQLRCIGLYARSEREKKGREKKEERKRREILLPATVMRHYRRRRRENSAE